MKKTIKLVGVVLLGLLISNCSSNYQIKSEKGKVLNQVPKWYMADFSESKACATPRFGKEKDKGLMLDGPKFKVVKLNADYSIDDILVHNPKDRNLGLILSEMTYDENLPVPIGILYKENKPTYDAMMKDQINTAKTKKNNLQSIIEGPNSWEVK